MQLERAEYWINHNLSVDVSGYQGICYNADGSVHEIIKQYPNHQLPNNLPFFNVIQEEEYEITHTILVEIGPTPWRKGQFFQFIPAAGEKYWSQYTHYLVHIPKTAGTSIRSRLAPDSFFGHMFARNYPSDVRKKLFTVVRNPYDRLVSAYCFIVRGGFNHNTKYLYIRDHYRDFADWVLNFLSEEYIHYHPNNCSFDLLCLQQQFICDDYDELILPIENILRYENLDEDIHKILPNIELPKYNTSEHQHWTQYYSNQQLPSNSTEYDINKAVQEKVYQLYKADFELLGYSHNLH